MTDYNPSRRPAPRSQLLFTFLTGAAIAASNIGVADPFDSSNGFNDGRTRDEDG